MDVWIVIGFLVGGLLCWAGWRMVERGTRRRGSSVETLMGLMVGGAGRWSCLDRLE